MVSTREEANCIASELLMDHPLVLRFIDLQKADEAEIKSLVGIVRSLRIKVATLERERIALTQKSFDV